MGASVEAAPRVEERGTLPRLVGFGVLAFAVCFAVRLSTLGDLAFWLDEVVTSDVAGKGWSELTGDRLSRGHSPVYFGLIKILGLSGASEFMLRLPSAVLDSAAGAFFAVIARQLSGRIGGLVMIVLYAFTPLLINYGQEARPWAMLLFFVGLAALGYTAAIMATELGTDALPPERKRQALFGFATATIGCIGAGLTLTAGWVAIAAMQIGAVLVPGIRRRGYCQRLWFAHVAITWLAVTPIVLGLMATLERARGRYWTTVYAEFGLSTMGDLVQALYLLTINLDPNRLIPGSGAPLPALLLLGFALISLIRHRSRPVLRFVAFVAFAIPIALIAASAIQSVLVPRYYLASLPFLHLLMADGAALLVQWRTVLGGIVVAAACAGVALQGSQALVAERKLEVRPLTDFIKQHHDRKMGKVVLLGAPFRRDDPSVNDLLLAGTLGYYLRPHIEVEYKRHAPAKPKTLADRLRGQPAITVLVRDVGKLNLQRELPPGAVGCEWVYRHLQVMVVARSRADLPNHLQDCAPYNGPLHP